jgi:hypothetical protein
MKVGQAGMQPFNKSQWQKGKCKREQVKLEVLW